MDDAKTAGAALQSRPPKENVPDPRTEKGIPCNAPSCYWHCAESRVESVFLFLSTVKAMMSANTYDIDEWIESNRIAVSKLLNNCDRDTEGTLFIIAIKQCPAVVTRMFLYSTLPDAQSTHRVDWLIQPDVICVVYEVSKKTAASIMN